MSLLCDTSGFVDMSLWQHRAYFADENGTNNSRLFSSCPTPDLHKKITEPGDLFGDFIKSSNLAH
jgi:ABC-type metal ion transport system substrate-binding protein